MSIEHKITIIQADNYLELEETSLRLEEQLNLYAKRHKDFSVIIEKNLELNQLVLKVLYLNEHMN